MALPSAILEMYRGDQVTWQFTVTWNGAALDITGATIRFTVRADYPLGTVISDADAVFTITTADDIALVTPLSGIFEVTVKKAKTYTLNIQQMTDYKCGIEILLVGDTEPTTIGHYIFRLWPDVVRA